MQQDLFGICPYVTAQRLLTGKWTLLILHELNERTMRFGELQAQLARFDPGDADQAAAHDGRARPCGTKGV